MMLVPHTGSLAGQFLFLSNPTFVCLFCVCMCVRARACACVKLVQTSTAMTIAGISE